MTDCTHPQTRTLYRRGPKRLFLPYVLTCLDCPRILDVTPQQRKAHPPEWREQRRRLTGAKE